MRVINFVTRKSFRSIAVQQIAGTTTEGGGAANYADLTATRIDGSRHTSLTASHLRQNRILQNQRGIVPDQDILFATEGNVTGVDGAGLTPGLDALAGPAITRAAVPTDPAARRSLASYAAGNPTAVTDWGPTVLCNHASIPCAWMGRSRPRLAERCEGRST